MYADDIFVHFENENECAGKLMHFYYKTYKETSTVLCFVEKHLGSC